MSSEIVLVIKKYSLDLAVQRPLVTFNKSPLVDNNGLSQVKVADKEMEVIIIWFEKCA